MKIQIISDTHMQHDKVVIEKCDLLIHCGDFGRWGTIQELQVFSKWLQKIQLEGLYRHCIFVPGNHDKCFETSASISKNMLLSAEVLMNNVTEFEGVKIYGSPYSLRFGNWSFMAEEKQLDHMYRQIPDDIDILITHGPPKCILDETLFGDKAGSVALLEQVLRVKPYIHCFGHIHEDSGHMFIGGTHYVNSAVVSLRQHPRDEIKKPFIFEV